MLMIQFDELLNANTFEKNKKRKEVYINGSISTYIFPLKYAIVKVCHFQVSSQKIDDRHDYYDKVENISPSVKI